MKWCVVLFIRKIVLNDDDGAALVLGCCRSAGSTERLRSSCKSWLRSSIVEERPPLPARRGRVAEAFPFEENFDSMNTGHPIKLQNDIRCLRYANSEDGQSSLK